jgi:hypothetical protein
MYSNRIGGRIEHLTFWAYFDTKSGEITYDILGTGIGK